MRPRRRDSIGGQCVAALILSSGVGAGCVSIHVEALTQETYPAETRPMAVLQAEPSWPHLKLARIMALSQSASEEGLREKILCRARSLGADVVVFGPSDVLETMGPSPLYQPTLIPGGTGYRPFAWGWWNPIHMDLWSFVQGSSDEEEWTLYQSGLAIRYEPVHGAGGTR